MKIFKTENYKDLIYLQYPFSDEFLDKVGKMFVYKDSGNSYLNWLHSSKITAFREKIENDMNIFKIQDSISSQFPFSVDYLENVAKMFLYVYSCPDILKPWFNFYSDLFQNQSPQQMLLTLNRMIKNNGNSNSKDSRAIAKKLFMEATDLMSLKYNDIQRMIPGRTMNDS